MFDDDPNASAGVCSSDQTSSTDQATSSSSPQGTSDGGVSSSDQTSSTDPGISSSQNDQLSGGTPDASTGDGHVYSEASQDLPKDNYTSSDDSAASAGSDRAVDSTSGGCSGAGSQETCSTPCDIDDLVLNEIPGSKQTAYHLEDGSFVAEPPQGSARAISLTGFSNVPKQLKLQVIGDRPGTAATTQIRVFVYPFASCGSSHAQVVATGPDGTDIEQTFSSQGTFDFPVTRYQSDNTAAALFERFITIGLPPTSYVASVTSCGIRGDGQSVNTGGQLIVEVFPADQYQFSLSIPPLSKSSHTRARTYTSDTTTDTTSHSSDDQTKTTTDTTDTETGITVTDDEPEKEEEEKPKIDLKRNGQSDDVTVSINKLIEILQDIKKAVKSIQDVLHNWVPQAGFKFEFELAFLSGDVKIACGWKEWTDWQVYYAFSAGVHVNLIKMSLILSFGFQLGPGLARLEGKIDDAGVSINQDCFYNTPETRAELSWVEKIELPLVLQGRMEADVYVAKFSYAAGAKTGFGGEGGFRLKDKWSCFAEVKWSGIDAFISESRPTSGEEEKLWHLVDKKDIWNREVEL